MKVLAKKTTALMIGVLLNVGGIGLIASHPVSAQTICQTYRVTRYYGLYVYVDAGNRIITTLPHNAIVRVTGLSDDGVWADIRYLRVDGLYGRGWVAAEYLRCFQD